MLSTILKSFSGRPYRKFIKECQPIVQQINTLEVEYQSLSESALKMKTTELSSRVRAAVAEALEKAGPNASEDKIAEISATTRQKVLDEILPEAFAVVKNAARRLCDREFEVRGHPQVWNMIHYDVQLIGGIALHRRMIAEMQTGEGKTLVSTCPLYLNALAGLNCQLVTVNEYLALRDSEWMGNLFKFLGLTVGCIQNQMDPSTKRAMYQCNITYGTASEFGFDYLRDNGMSSRKGDQVQRDHYFCIIDEADSILVDEARTPLIISGPMQEDRPLPFDQLKPGIQRLARQQERLCTDWANEAKKILDDPEGDRREAMRLLTQVKWGAPKNKQLMRLLENGDVHKSLEKFDSELNADFQKEEKFRIKEALLFQIDEKQHQADLTEKGREYLKPGDPSAFLLQDLPTLFNEIDADSSLNGEDKQQQKLTIEQDYQRTSEEIHTISQLLRAYCIYERDMQYVVQDGKVQIVDENTGRVMPGRRWSDGLHQAVEAKEGVKIEKETKTYATVTIQNYFRMYEKLAGMTGTAETEAGEFFDIYRLKVMVIPTHRPNQRADDDDVVYKTRRAKFNAVINEITEAHKIGQPVLVGTASVEASELLSRMLRRANIRHTVLNAKLHAQEAEVVARAGQKSAVTIATNMAGRGTDIKLGEGVEALGGLFVVGTERHESRRIDRQLRGRCARQGDSGRSKFFISLEDDLMRLFANAGPISKILNSSMDDEEELSHSALNWSIQNAQKKVEQQNYLVRKRLLSYDDVLNNQREVVYGIRNDAIHSETPKNIIFEMIDEELEERIDTSEGESEALLNWLNQTFPIGLKEEDIKDKDHSVLREELIERIKEAYAMKADLEDPEHIHDIERYIVVRSLDRHWQDHLTEMEELRRAVGLRGYGQKDPLSEYKSEGFRYFQEMMNRARTDMCAGVFRTTTNPISLQGLMDRLKNVANQQGPSEAGGAGLPQQMAAAQTAMASQAQKGPEQRTPTPRKELPKIEPIRREAPKVGRNETVVIRKGAESRELKFKKAEPLITNEGWVLVSPKK
ncbi:MAG: preprotein translocase subunit SecA [Verrucomicrobiota bacterium]